MPLALTVGGCMDAFEIPEPDSPGGKAYLRHCSLCHALPDPERMLFSQWVPVMERMARNIRAQNVPQMSEEERILILQYLKRHAKPAGN